MRFFATSLLLLLPILSQVEALTVPRLAARQDQQLKKTSGSGAGGKAGTKVTKGTNSKASNSETTAAATGKNNTAAADNNNNNNDPQTSLTLDPRVISKGFANDGQDVPAQGQVASLTSTNNFINFCLTLPGVPLTNGKQIPTGSCNNAPIGHIPSTDNMPSAKFQNPKNGDTIPANKAFTISMAIKNMETGNFVNAQESYFAAPQQLNKQGQIIGHSHVVVEQLDSLDQTTPTDPKKFAFFKGLNAAASGGVLTADVANGLPPAAYRLCSINSAANHQPAIVAIAQHGALDDCVYFTASNDGAADGNDNNSTTTADTGKATKTKSAAASKSTAASKNQQTGKQQAGKKKGGK